MSCRYRLKSRIPAAFLSSLLLSVSLVTSSCTASDQFSDPMVDNEPEFNHRVHAMLQRLPESKEFTAWLASTGTQPPREEDFPSIPEVMNPLQPLGQPESKLISTPEQWNEQKAKIREALQQWVLGQFPEDPAVFSVTRLQSHMEWDAVSHNYRLSFGPDSTRLATLDVELFVPDGNGPFPVFMTQSNHRSWARIAMQRGYLGVVYAAADIDDDAAKFGLTWPHEDWALLAKRAWAASRTIDFLETFPSADTNRIAIAGHSRNGKQSLIAGAFDERIDAVVSSSAGAGGLMPWRISTEYEYAESIERMTRVFPSWFLPKLRFFAGHEDRLPVDMNLMAALIAPRGLLASTAVNDGVEQTWAVQRSLDSIKPVWELYDEEQNIGVQWRSGGHDTHPEIIQRYLDWLDACFAGDPSSFTDPPMHPSDWNDWAERTNLSLIAESKPSGFDLLHLNNGVEVNHKDIWLNKRWEMQQTIRDALGIHPPGAKSGKIDYGSDPPYINVLLDRQDAGDNVRKIDFVFGDYISGDLYFSPGQLAGAGDLPAVLFLHPANRPRGYVASYKFGDHFFRKLARSGYAVFCFDMIGYGRRVDEDRDFYNRYPDWSLLGKMVWDARTAMDRIGELPRVDDDRVYIAGYGLGAWVALYAAALDHRHAGTIAIAPPGPLIVDHDNPHGLDWLNDISSTTLLQPELAMYRDNGDTPYDLEHLFAASAPKPLLVVQPRLNWRVDHTAQMNAVVQARKIYALYNARDNLSLKQPDLNVALDPQMQRIIIEWLLKQDALEEE